MVKAEAIQICHGIPTQDSATPLIGRIHFVIDFEKSPESANSSLLGAIHFVVSEPSSTRIIKIQSKLTLNTFRDFVVLPNPESSK